MKAERSTLAEYQKPLKKDRQVKRDKDFHGMVRRFVDASRSAGVVEGEVAIGNEADIVKGSTCKLSNETIPDCLSNSFPSDSIGTKHLPEILPIE